MNLGVLASHEGTTLQSLLDAFAGGRIPGRVSVVVSNNGDSGALVKARQAGVQAVHLSSRTHRDPATLDAAIRDRRSPSSVMPSAVKKAIAAARSSTTTLTWSNLLIVMSPV
jgi:folate-dependent phosphoribosylglycinamide formyltransferase PurN